MRLQAPVAGAPGLLAVVARVARVALLKVCLFPLQLPWFWAPTAVALCSGPLLAWQAAKAAAAASDAATTVVVPLGCHVQLWLLAWQRT